MNFMRRLEALIWGVLSNIFTILPKILALLGALGWSDTERKIRDALHRGGLEADDFVEEHADKILGAAVFFENLADAFYDKAQLLREVHYEGTRERAEGEADAFTVEQMEEFIKTFLRQDNQLACLMKGGAVVVDELSVVAKIEPKRDVSAGPGLA